MSVSQEKGEKWEWEEVRRKKERSLRTDISEMWNKERRITTSIRLFGCLFVCHIISWILLLSRILRLSDPCLSIKTRLDNDFESRASHTAFLIFSPVYACKKCSGCNLITNWNACLLVSCFILTLSPSIHLVNACHTFRACNTCIENAYPLSVICFLLLLTNACEKEKRQIISSPFVFRIETLLTIVR